MCQLRRRGFRAGDDRDTTHLHGAAELENRTACGDARGLVQVTRLDDREAAQDLFRLGVRSVGDRPSLSTDHFSGGPIQRMTDTLELPFLGQLLEPAVPFGYRALGHFG